MTSLYLWIVVLAIIGYGKRCFNRETAFTRYLPGMSLSEIAKSEHSAVSSVHEGIQRGLRRPKKFWKKFEPALENNL